MAEQQQRLRRRPRTFRPRMDPFHVYDDAQFVVRYRLDKAGARYVTDLVREDITNTTQRTMAVTPEMKVAVTLRYLATGKMQLCNADDLVCLSIFVG